MSLDNLQMEPSIVCRPKWRGNSNKGHFHGMSARSMKGTIEQGHILPTFCPVAAVVIGSDMTGSVGMGHDCGTLMLSTVVRKYRTEIVEIRLPLDENLRYDRGDYKRGSFQRQLANARTPVRYPLRFYRLHTNIGFPVCRCSSGEVR